MKHIGTDKETQYDEPEVIDEAWERKNGQLVKMEGKDDDAKAGQQKQ